MAKIPQFKATALNGTLQSYSGETPWTKWGILPLLIALVASFILPGRKIISRSRNS